MVRIKSESDFCYCLKYILIPLHYLCLFQHPPNVNEHKSNIIFKISKLLLAMISALFVIRYLGNLFYTYSYEAINFGFAIENVKCAMSCTGNSLTFYWIMKQEKMIYQLISMVNQFKFSLKPLIKKQLKNKIIWKSFILNILDLVRFSYFMTTINFWDTKYYSHRLLFNIQFGNNSIAKIIMAIDYTMFLVLCHWKVLLIIFYMICYFVHAKIQQFNEIVENLEQNIYLERDRIFILKK